MTTIHKELRHRGPALVDYPDSGLFQTLGGAAGVAGLIGDLYRRIESDPLLHNAFPHFNPAAATPFFVQWFGGPRVYSDDLEAGLIRRHQHRYVSPKAAAAWLGCMREALKARGVEHRQVMAALTRVAKAMIHSPDVVAGGLCRSCGLVQDPGQEQFGSLIKAAAKGGAAIVRKALAKDPSVGHRRGLDNRTLAWVAAYHNRPEVLSLVLGAGGDCNVPACDPLHATLACDVVHEGTVVSVTPLAVARKWRAKLVGPLAENGAIDDVFTAAWLGDLASLRDYLDRNPDLANAIDPAEDFQEVTPLCHAVAGGNIDAARLLIERGAEVTRHSGKLLKPAVVMNRPDLVKLLLDHGADAQRVSLLGRLDDVGRPVADLLVAHGKTVPAWMLPRVCRPDTSTNEVHRVTVLLDYGADVNSRGQYGRTALHYAVRGGKVPLIKLLLDRGADVNAMDDEGLTPLLHLAKTRSKADPIPVMRLLAEAGADLTAMDRMGKAAAKLGRARAEIK